MRDNTNVPMSMSISVPKPRPVNSDNKLPLLDVLGELTGTVSDIKIMVEGLEISLLGGDTPVKSGESGLVQSSAYQKSVDSLDTAQEVARRLNSIINRIS